MGQADTRIAGTREICERTASAAVLEGSIASLGSQYVLGLRSRTISAAVGFCRTGACGHERNPQCPRTRCQQIQKPGWRIAGDCTKNTTSRLPRRRPHRWKRLKPKHGWKVNASAGEAAALPLFKRAVEIDQQFAMAYAALGVMYSTNAEPALAVESASKAYALRDRVSDKNDTLSTLLRWPGDRKPGKSAAERESGPALILVSQRRTLSWRDSIYPASGKYEQAVAEGIKRSNSNQIPLSDSQAGIELCCTEPAGGERQDSAQRRRSQTG